MRDRTTTAWEDSSGGAEAMENSSERQAPVMASLSVALTLVPFEAQPLCSHALYLFVERAHLLVVPLVLRFGPVALAQLLQRFLDREFGGVSHG